MSSRALVFLAAVLAHIVLIALLASDRAARREAAADESRMVLVFLAPEPTVMPAEPAASSPRGLRAVTSAPNRASPPAESHAISESPPAAPPPGPSIDWMGESQLSAKRQVDALEAERRRSRGFTAREQDRERAGTPAPPPEFGWDRSSTQRVEAIPSGGMLIHLNDRCALAFAVLIIPVCKIGKIEARGDLFEHMNDTPQLGDPK